MKKKIEINLEGITQYIDELKQTKAKTEFDLKQINAEIEKQEKVLQSFLEQEGVEEMTFGVYRFGWKITKRNIFDQKNFKNDNPELYEKYISEREYKNFEFKVG